MVARSGVLEAVEWSSMHRELRRQVRRTLGARMAEEASIAAVRTGEQLRIEAMNRLVHALLFKVHRDVFLVGGPLWR